MGVLIKQHRTEGFKVEVRKSSIRGGGLGLWLSGTAKPGTVLALYPGERRAADTPLTDTTYCVEMVNGGWLDASPAALQRVRAGRIAAGVSAAVCDADARLPLLSAHRANHPANGTRPKAIIHEVPCCDQLPWSCSAQNGCLETVVVLLAVSEVRDEEIFVDYGWDKHKTRLPPWYRPVKYKSKS